MSSLSSTAAEADFDYSLTHSHPTSVLSVKVLLCIAICNSSNIKTKVTLSSFHFLFREQRRVISIFFFGSFDVQAFHPFPLTDPRSQVPHDNDGDELVSDAYESIGGTLEGV